MQFTLQCPSPSHTGRCEFVGVKGSVRLTEQQSEHLLLHPRKQDIRD